MNKHLTGLIAAPHTPMHSDGSLHLDMIEKQAALLAAQGVTGTFICGTTGEGPSLTLQERKHVAERWAAVRNDLALIVHVGHNSLAEARVLAAHAQKQGAGAIAAFAPSFFKPAGVEDLVAYCAAVAAAAPDIPFYYYHIPAMTGVRLSMVEFLRQGGEAIPTLRGLKYSEANLAEFRQCAHLDDGAFNLLFGVDERLLGALEAGASGAVGSTYNYAATNYLRMIEAYRAGDRTAAQAYAQNAIDLVESWRDMESLAAGKALMSLRGVDCGPVRPPLHNLTDEQRARLFARARALPVFEPQ